MSDTSPMRPKLAQPYHRIGVISDTHGILRPAAIAALAGSDLILHAGDIGTPDVVEQLRAIAPVVAVRGNHRRLGSSDSRAGNRPGRPDFDPPYPHPQRPDD